ncbi:MAG TPA: efflux transporter outer membrane subunit [Sphingomonas sp.]|uniref:efflux transporter outer membrane subunit n=1 Tax=Sphingomonas sp. TaxID=28214 RepID=UPI002C2364CC|nr:efflux transporter outer membrane subunit [Sphingomonas sp.]HMI18262.1 efflux transporter outer membrane subunit [Sphingomonas sp.]
MKRAAALLALSALTACSMDPHYVRPTPAVPPSFPQGGAYAQQNEAPLPSVSYRDIFRDARLQAIVEQALANNQDLRQALANIQSARALYRVQRADIFPAIDASAGVTTRRGSTPGGTNTGTGGTTNGGTSGHDTVTTYDLQAGTTAWEIDLFGRLQSLSRSAFNQYLATDAAARATRLTLVSDIADAWLQLAADRSLLLIAEDTEKSAQTSVDLTQKRLDGGVAPRTDLRQAQTVLATAQADHARQMTLVAQDINALQLLVGAPVADTLLPTTIEDADGKLAELPAGLDSTILLRRPDVVEAEYQLRASNARIGAARAAFFPRISLTAVAGLASTALSSLFTGGAFAWTVAPSATLPIFDGGANAGNLAYAKAQREAYLAAYQKAIQTAFREVSDALARRGTIDAETQADQLNATAAEDTLNLDIARYRQGIDPYLNTLDAQRTFYAARQTVVNIRLTRAQNLVDLYQTLGGDQLVQAMPPPPLPGSARK